VLQEHTTTLRPVLASAKPALQVTGVPPSQLTQLMLILTNPRLANLDSTPNLAVHQKPPTVCIVPLDISALSMEQVTFNYSSTDVPREHTAGESLVLRPKLRLVWINTHPVRLTNAHVSSTVLRV